MTKQFMCRIKSVLFVNKKKITESLHTHDQVMNLSVNLAALIFVQTFTGMHDAYAIRFVHLTTT